jgi:hypothetical protein
MISPLITPDIVESGERILLSRPGPNLDYWDGED